MSRIKIELPEKMAFTGSLTVRITDINYGGHAGNDSIVAMIHEARVQFLKKLGYGELELENAGLIMSDLAVEYKTELFHGDVLNMYVAAGDFSRIGFGLYYQLKKVTGEQETIAANARTGMICYDYNLKKAVALPGAARIKLENAV